MAESTEEIAIKLGVSQNDLEFAIKDAQREVKKLKEIGDSTKDDGNGLMKSFQQTKQQFEQLKNVLAAAGMLKMVGDFFSSAIGYADRYKGATNENIEAVKRFGEGYKVFGELMMNVSTKALGTVNLFGEAIGSTMRGWWESLKGTRAEWEANNRAMEETGKSLRTVTKEIAEQKAYTEEHKKLNQEMEALRKKELEQNLKNMTDLEQINALENRRVAIQREIDGGQLSRVELHRAEVEMKRISLALDEKSAAYQEKEIADSRKTAEDQRAAALGKLQSAEKQALIEREILDIQSLLTSKVLNQKDTEYFTGLLKARQLELTKAQVEEHKILADLSLKEAERYAKQLDQGREEMSIQERKRSLLSEERNLKDLILRSDEASKEHAFYLTRMQAVKTDLTKTEKDLKSSSFEIAKLLLSTGGKLTEEQEERLKLLKGETTEAAQQSEIHLLTLKLLDGSITPAEKQRLGVLTGQTDQLKKQAEILVLLDKLNSGTISPTERERLDQLTKQRELLKDQVEQMEKIYRIGLQIKGDSDGSLEEYQLREKVANLKSTLAAMQASEASVNASGYAGTYIDPRRFMTEKQLADAQEELSSRSLVSGLLSRYDEERAFTLSGMTRSKFERVLSTIDVTDAETKQNIASIEKRLKKIVPL